MYKYNSRIQRAARTPAQERSARQGTAHRRRSSIRHHRKVLCPWHHTAADTSLQLSSSPRSSVWISVVPASALSPLTDAVVRRVAVPLCVCSSASLLPPPGVTSASMSSLDAYLAAHERQESETRPRPQQQRRPPPVHARTLSDRNHTSSSSIAHGDENDAAAANGATRASPPQPQPHRRDGYQAAKSRLLSQTTNTEARRSNAHAGNTAAATTQKPLLVKSAGGGFARRPASAAAAAASASILTPRSRRAAVNAGMSGAEYVAMHGSPLSPAAARVSPAKAKTGLYPSAGAAHSRRTSSVSFAPAATAFGSPATAGEHGAAFRQQISHQQQHQQHYHAHGAFAPSSPPGGWFSPARSSRGHIIPAGSDHVPFRPSPADAAAGGSLFNAAECSPLNVNQDRVRFHAEVERAVFSPPRDSSLNAPNFATRRFSSPPAIAGAPPTVFHSPLSASWIQAIRARTARIMNLASTNAAASGNSPPFDPRAAAMNQAHSPFDPHAPSHSSASLARTRDRISKQNLILSPSILRSAPDGGRSMVSTPGTPSLDSRGNTPPPLALPAPGRFAGMGVGVPAFMLRSPAIMARHRAAVAAEGTAPSAVSSATGPVASASARQEAHQVLLAQNPQRQQLLEEYRQGLREMEMGVTSVLQQQPQPPAQSQPLQQPFTSQILPVPIEAARAVQNMESLPVPQPMHRSPPVAAQGRGHSVATSPMAFGSPTAPSHQQQQQPPIQHVSPFVHRMIGSGGRHSQGHGHGDDDECEGCAAHAHHHHALAPRVTTRRDVQTSPLALMPSPAHATARSAMTSPMPMPLQQQQQQFGSPLRPSPIRPASGPAAVPSIVSASSATVSSVPASLPAQALSLADRINSNLAGLRQLNSRANHIAARSPVAPAVNTNAAQALPSVTTTIPTAHEAHRNVLQRIDRIVNLTKQPVAPDSQRQQQQQAQAQPPSFFPSHSSERSLLSLPTPAALSGAARAASEAKYPDLFDQHAMPLLHDISELTNSAMEDSFVGGANRSFQHQAQSQSATEGQDRERFRMWQQRLLQNQQQLQQQQQPTYFDPPISFAPQQAQQHHLPSLPQPPEPVFHSDGISDALAQSLRNIQSLRSSLANSRGLPPQQQQYSQSLPVATHVHYAPGGYPQPFAYSATAAHGAPFAPTAHLHSYAASEPGHDNSHSSNGSGSGGGVRLEFHQAPFPLGMDSTSIRVGAALVPEVHPPPHHLLQPGSVGLGWIMPGWAKLDARASDAGQQKVDSQHQPQHRRASIATTICSEGELSPPRCASSAGSSRTTTPPSPSPAVAAAFVLVSPPPSLGASASAAAAAPSRARLQPFTPVAASGIFAQAFRTMVLEHTPAARARAIARTVQPSPQQLEQMHTQQRHNASMLSQLNRQI